MEGGVVVVEDKALVGQLVEGWGQLRVDGVAGEALQHQLDHVVALQENGQTVGFNAYFSLAQQLGRKGYNVLGYHPNGDMYGRAMSHTNLESPNFFPDSSSRVSTLK